MQVIDTSKLTPAPWKNAGGSTRTLAVSPEGAGFENFDWRVSIADVKKSGDFSVFPGVNRTILLLDGRGMMLHNSDGSIHPLTAPFRPWTLRGDERVWACLLNGSARDFNVMVRRGRAQASVHVWQTAVSLEDLCGDALFYCARGAFAISVKGLGDVELGAGCAVRADGITEVRISPAAPDAVLIGVFLVPAV